MVTSRKTSITLSRLNKGSQPKTDGFSKVFKKRKTSKVKRPWFNDNPGIVKNTMVNYRGVLRQLENFALNIGDYKEAAILHPHCPQTVPSMSPEFLIKFLKLKYYAKGTPLTELLARTESYQK